MGLLVPYETLECALVCHISGGRYFNFVRRMADVPSLKLRLNCSTCVRPVKRSPSFIHSMRFFSFIERRMVSRRYLKVYFNGDLYFGLVFSLHLSTL